MRVARAPGAGADSQGPRAGAASGLLGRDEEELLRAHLKRKHAASILSLKEEFMRARKKGKLPKDATSALKSWWTGNLVWPYPTARQRRAARATRAHAACGARTTTSASWATRRGCSQRKSITVRAT